MKTISIDKSVISSIIQAHHASSGDLMRPALMGVNLTPAFAEASDGYCLARVEYRDPIAMETSLLLMDIHPPSMKKFLKTVKGNTAFMFIGEGFVSFGLSDTFNPALCHNVRVSDKEFIKADSIINGFKSEESFKFGVNANYLLKVAKSIACCAREEGQVIIEIQKDSMGVKPMKVTTKNGKSFGMVMPMKVE